jgi:hypothetical protein
MLEYLSLAICPNVPDYWRPAGLLLAGLVAATLLLLAVVSLRTPGERPRALGLMAIILAMLDMAAAIGLSRSGLGPGTGLSSRYITLAVPMLGALYIAWLAYGPALTQRGIHVGLLVVVCMVMPANTAFGLRYGRDIRAHMQSVERGLTAGMSASQLMSRACPALFSSPKIVYESFQMLRAARIGRFAYFVDDRVAASPDPSRALR